MVLGFNHNIRYKGELFHVQTEDSGRANPHIVTLLYRGGTIIASKKTSYADIIKAEQLELVVESIMKDQHKEMMKRLTAGEFDARIFPGQDAAASPTGTGSVGACPPPSAAAAPPTGSGSAGACPLPAVAPQGAATTFTPPTDPPAPPSKRSLDEVILDYLITGEDK